MPADEAGMLQPDTDARTSDQLCPPVIQICDQLLAMRIKQHMRC